MTIKQDPRLNRREFVVGASTLALSAGLGGCSDRAAGPDSGGRADAGAGADHGGGADRGVGGDRGAPDSARPAVPAGRVVEVHDPRAVSGKTVDSARVRAMLEAGLKALAGAATLKQAWSTLLPDFSPSMRVGLKVNTLNLRVSTRPEVVAALVGSMTRDLGAAAARILVWDREYGELGAAGLTDKTVGGARIDATRGLPTSKGYDTARPKVRDKYTRLSRIITEDTDLTINLPVLKTHDIGGVTGAIKNLYGCINNPGSFHLDFNDYAPAVYAVDPISRHFRLVINNALYGIARRLGPVGPADVIPCRLLLSLDPVAADAHALALINQLRDSGSPVPVQLLGWLNNAEAAGLGTTRVRLKKVTL
jgi:uncharacterized protein (DUF362 family)